METLNKETMQQNDIEDEDDDEDEIPPWRRPDATPEDLEYFRTACERYESEGQYGRILSKEEAKEFEERSKKARIENLKKHGLL